MVMRVVSLNAVEPPRNGQKARGRRQNPKRDATLDGNSLKLGRTLDLRAGQTQTVIYGAVQRRAVS